MLLQKSINIRDFVQSWRRTFRLANKPRSYVFSLNCGPCFEPFFLFFNLEKNVLMLCPRMFLTTVSRGERSFPAQALVVNDWNIYHITPHNRENDRLSGIRSSGLAEMLEITSLLECTTGQW